MLRTLLIAFSILATSGVAACAEESSSIDRFVGSYTGSVVVDPSGNSEERDSSVTIQKIDEGFAVEWITVLPGAGDEVERRVARIEFHRTRRENIYFAAQRRDRFGNVQPLDPIRGDPYFWASISGNTLVIHGVHVTDDGGYELQTYERQVTENGMSLHFRRTRNGQVIRDIRGSLTRVE